MSATVAPAPPKKKSSPLLYILGLVVLLLVVTGAIYEWHSHNKSSSSSATSDFTEYKATKYGFKFNYPQKWGTPEVISHSKQYQISFAPASGAKTGYQVSIIFGASSDSLSKNDVQQALAANKNKYVQYDSTSFAALTTDPANGASSELSIYQTVNLSKIGVSAISLNWTKLGNSHCPTNQFSETTSCISSTDYSVANETVKSFSGL